MRRRFAVVPLFAVAASLAGCALFAERSSNRYVVFYQPLSAKLDPSAKGVVDGAAGFALRHPTQPVVVVGFADPDGSPAANIAISHARAQVVTDELTTFGVPASRITSLAHGQIGFSSNSVESRRVEIDVGQP
jgi:outer membrane protein OmpA-like peptidoglycan-associated protein